MTTSNLTVAKVGGSLFDWPELPLRLREFIDARKAAFPEEQMVLVAGGGPAADLVRALDRVHDLGDETADRLALHAMDLTAQILAELLPGAVAVINLEMLRSALSSGSLPVLAPRQLLADAERTEESGLPASWNVTSDTIAAWIALQTGAAGLILVKSVTLPAGATRLDAARLGLVDPMFCTVAEPLERVEYLNLRERISQTRLLP